LIIQNANTVTARDNIDEALQVTADVFINAIAQRRDNLLGKVRALSADYAFKPAAHTNDHKTVLSTLLSYQQRADADVMLLLTMNSDIIADTKHPELTEAPFYLPQLITQATNNEYGEADMIDFIDGQAYLVVAVPLFSPHPSHWIIMGFKLTDEFSLSLQKNTKSHVSLLFNSKKPVVTGNHWQQLSSTLSDAAQLESEQALGKFLIAFNHNFDLVLVGQNFVSRAIKIEENKQGHFVALLQRSLEQALLPYQQLQLVVASVFFVALLLLVTGGIFIARKITRPVTVLTHGAKEIEQGHYDFTIDIDQEDELGKLAKGFNSMAKGLADRAKVRNLLGKVVSPAIAEELLNKGVELGGEERQATIVFCDIRNFTSLCENHDAKQILTLLNDLLTRLSGVIDQHNGVIDKYIGDAVMALFGVPIVDKQQAQHAVLAAIAMQKEVSRINNELVYNMEISLGIGVNSAFVVAGNMGSQTRLNYSVIGDGVNISSRLESLTKYYGVPILVSDTTKQLCSEIAFREIDTVRVKGKKKGLTIYQAIAKKEEISAIEARKTQLFEQALVFYKKQQWQDALIIFNELLTKNPTTKYYQIYIHRVHELKRHKYNAEWEPIFTHQEK